MVGICGYARSGKDTLASKMVERLGYERRAFGDIMREILFAVNPIIIGSPSDGYYHPMRLANIVRMRGWELTKQIPEVRELMQRLGTEAGRSILGENIWVDALFREPLSAPLVVSDVRFQNEADAIRERGGIIVRVVRNGVNATNGHSSEHTKIEYDFCINNDSTPDALYESFLSELNKAI